jgi:hypothetical protein
MIGTIAELISLLLCLCGVATKKNCNKGSAKVGLVFAIIGTIVNLLVLGFMGNWWSA